MSNFSFELSKTCTILFLKQRSSRTQVAFIDDLQRTFFYWRPPSPTSATIACFNSQIYLCVIFHAIEFSMNIFDW